MKPFWNRALRRVALIAAAFVATAAAHAATPPEIRVDYAY